MEFAIGEFGRRLRQLREARGLTQRQLADPYFTHAYVSTIESGRRFPSERALVHFASRLGIDPDQLKTGRPPTLESDIELGLVEARRLISEGNLRQAQARLTDLRQQTRDYGLSHNEARAISGLALCSERKGELVEAGEMYLTAQRMLASEPLTFSVEAICGEARCLMLQGDIRFAIHRLETTVAALEKQGLQDPSAMLRLNSSLVGAYFELGLHPRAYQCAEEALRLAPYVEDRERLALAYLNVAWALNHQGRDKDARDALQRASFLFDELDLKLELARAHQARGMLLARQTKRRAARSELIRAKEVFAHAKSPVDLARTLNELGRLERLGGRLDTARHT